MADAAFFDAPTVASLKKHRIVSKYYGGWANIVLPRALQREGKIMYTSLFCGPGRYKDGTRSTPLLILDHTIAVPLLRENVQLVFNDQNQSFIKELERHIADTEGVASLRYAPKLRNKTVDRSIIPRILQSKVPTLYFADPWGYQGVSISLIEAALSYWGSDFLFFFNYNRINMNLGSEAMNEPINEFFSAERAARLRAEIGSLRPAEREQRILKEMQVAVKGLRAEFGKFTYRSETGSRSTHHLVCTSKHRQGMALFKEISAKESSRFDDEIPSLDHNPAANPGQSMLFSAMEQLETELVTIYAGRVMTPDEIYHQHHNGRPYILKNYRQALLHLEEVGEVTIEPAKSARTRREIIPTDARITFRKAG